MRRTRRYTRLRGTALAGLILAGLLLLAGCSLGSGDGWEQVGSTDGHIVLSLAADPFLKQIYVGTAGGMVYRLRTDQSGPLLVSEGLPKDAVFGVILPDLHTHELAYAGGSHGLYVTTDGGAHWQARGTGFPTDDTMGALIASGEQNTLIAGSQAHGIYVSYDAGATWQSSSAGMPASANVYTLLGDQSSHTIYAAVDGVGIFATTDQGHSWSERSVGLPAHIFALALLPNYGLDPSGTTLYAGTEQGLYASVDDGAHWALTGSLLATTRVLSLAPDLNAPGVLYAGTDVTVFRSSDGGRTWHGVAPGLNTHIASLLVVHGVVYAGTNEVVRYPSRSGTSLANGIVNLLFLLVLGGLGFLLLLRSRRRMQGMEQRIRMEAVERRERLNSGDDVMRDGQSSEHVQEDAAMEDARTTAEPEGNSDVRPR